MKKEKKEKLSPGLGSCARPPAKLDAHSWAKTMSASLDEKKFTAASCLPKSTTRSDTEERLAARLADFEEREAAPAHVKIYQTLSNFGGLVLGCIEADFCE